MTSDQVPFTPQPEPIKPPRYSAFMLGMYQGRQPPLMGSVVSKNLEAKARAALDDRGRIDAFMYVNGSAGTNSTYYANLAAFESYPLIPHMLRDATVRNTEITLFGTKYPNPILMAPIGVVGIMHPDAEVGAARAAGRVGVGYIMSTASTRSIEEVGAANAEGALANVNNGGRTGDRWYQLYWPRTNELTLSILARAKAAGFTALVLTLDTSLLSWRPHDIETTYLPFGHGVGIQVGTSDPVFMKRFGLAPALGEEAHSEWPYVPSVCEDKCAAGDAAMKLRKEMGSAFLGECNSGKFRTWEDLQFLRDNWGGPLILKGIQSVEDAETAVRLGIPGIVVSNHGGRQVDGALASLHALAAICASPIVSAAQKAGTFTVLFDSGIRTGSDIIKALALGAQAVFLGRPWMYGLAINGEKGVEEVLRSTLADLEVTMGLVGYKNIQELHGGRGKVVVMPKEPVY
ncbi:FMN-dependent alpha-hydroxy acid dehydrogenase [Athelia psychrophila]|uniref:FMN-dependent alpha-hydroxy acid dehydrogenase n=1 Tax=Athelia psychrophila TaxID=1759441 RepID=A0A167U178_9AGAM|nr:FMN-dependent alpha-hydroxy acid dehydrogenase [Fibularhizoctonia sp. CBS 109695]